MTTRCGLPEVRLPFRKQDPAYLEEGVFQCLALHENWIRALESCGREEAWERARRTRAIATNGTLTTRTKDVKKKLAFNLLSAKGTIYYPSLRQE